MLIGMDLSAKTTQQTSDGVTIMLMPVNHSYIKHSFINFAIKLHSKWSFYNEEKTC